MSNQQDRELNRHNEAEVTFSSTGIKGSTTKFQQYS